MYLSKVRLGPGSQREQTRAVILDAPPSQLRQGNCRRRHWGNTAAQLTIDCNTGDRGRETIRDSPQLRSEYQSAVTLKCSFWFTVTTARFHLTRACGL